MYKIDSYNFTGKKAIIRVDFNVPLNDKFEITDDTRIRAALPTIKKVIEGGGNPILMSHLGRPKGGFDAKFSLKHIVDHLSKSLGTTVKFAEDCVGEKAKSVVDSLAEGEVALLENLRFHDAEKKGDVDFAKQLSELADCYINDAFGTAHRAHASTTIIAQFFPEDKMFGYVIEKEVESVEKLLKSAEKPFTAILGGAKVSSKITVIENLMDKVDNLIVCGGMTYTFVKAQGGTVGDSICEDDYLETAKKILATAESKGVNIVLADDALAADDFSNDANTKVVDVNNIEDGWQGLDVGPKTMEKFAKVIKESKTVLWNGPTGVFEFETFEKGSRSAAEAIVEATKAGAFSLIGGGDSVACINKFGKANDVSYVSTGGGALLEFIEGKELPGIKAIRG